MKSFFKRLSGPEIQSIPVGKKQVDSTPKTSTIRYEYDDYDIDQTQKFDQLSASLSDYEILKLVGRGGFAKVYQIKRKQDERIFALKVMKKDVLRKMKQVSVD